MRVLMIGGGGVVGRSLVPHLVRSHTVSVLDRRRVQVPRATTVVGDATDLGVLREAVRGVDAVVHLAAVVPRGAEADDGGRIREAFEVNVTGVYLALRAAAGHGVGHFVHVSTMSVYRDYGRVPVDAGSAPDSTEPYGQSKRLGEQLCASAAMEGSMTITSLRLAQPTTEELWPLWRSPGTPEAEPRRPRLADGTEYNALAPDDLANAVEAALTRTGGYVAAAVTGDVDGVTLTNDPTSRLLGWRPQRR